MTTHLMLSIWYELVFEKNKLSGPLIIEIVGVKLNKLKQKI
jgi:hypothetical protein